MTCTRVGTSPLAASPARAQCCRTSTSGRVAGGGRSVTLFGHTMCKACMGPSIAVHVLQELPLMPARVWAACDSRDMPQTCAGCASMKVVSHAACGHEEV